jgi:hypothetical protein
MAGLKGLLRKGGLEKSARTDLVRQMSKSTGDISDVDLKNATDSTLGETGDALKKAESFFEKNKNVLMAGGLTATGIATVMLLTANKSPSVVAGIPIGDLTPGSKDIGDDGDGGDGDGDEDDGEDGGGGGGGRKKRMLEGFLKDWGLYLIILVVLIVVGVFVYLMTRGSGETLPENSG